MQTAVKSRIFSKNRYTVSPKSLSLFANDKFIGSFYLIAFKKKSSPIVNENLLYLYNFLSSLAQQGVSRRSQPLDTGSSNE